MMKAGFARDELPKCVFPNLSVFVPIGGCPSVIDGVSWEPSLGSYTHIHSYSLGRPKHDRVMVGDLTTNEAIGEKAQKHRGLLRLNYPMEHGIVNNWNDMELIWKFLYSKDQLNVAPEGTFFPPNWTAQKTMLSLCCWTARRASCPSYGSAAQPEKAPRGGCQGVCVCACVSLYVMVCVLVACTGVCLCVRALC